MKKLSIFLLIIVALTTCKKYPEGGFVNQTRKHLFGGHNVGDSKTWKLKLYEVNGIDSTYLIRNSATPDFYDITFEMTNKKYSNFTANTVFQKYTGSVGETFNITFYDIELTQQDSIQCKSTICYRNIFIPELGTKNRGWNVEKLTSTEIIINKSINNSYRIILIKK